MDFNKIACALFAQKIRPWYIFNHRYLHWISFNERFADKYKIDINYLCMQAGKKVLCKICNLFFFLEYFIKHPIMLIIIIIEVSLTTDMLGSLHRINSSMINWTKIFHKFWFSQGLSKYGCRWWGITVQRNKKALGAVVNILILTIRRGAGFENTRANEKIIRTCKGLLRLRRDGKKSTVFFLEVLHFSKNISSHHDAVRSRTSPGCTTLISAKQELLIQIRWKGFIIIRHDFLVWNFFLQRAFYHINYNHIFLA